MLVHDRPERHGRGGRRSWLGKRSRPQHDLRGGRDGAKGRVRSKGVVVPTPALDDDLGLLERGEDLAVEQLVPELTSVTPIERIASATLRPCETSTSTWRSLATISSGLCLFLTMDPSSFSSHKPYFKADHFKGGGSWCTGGATKRTTRGRCARQRRLEPDDERSSRPVLRGRGLGNEPRLPDICSSTCARWS